MSFSTDARLRGAPSGHVLDIRECGWPPAPSSW
jgi:formyltetrahydrofolate synthetase